MLAIWAVPVIVSGMKADGAVSWPGARVGFEVFHDEVEEICMLRVVRNPESKLVAQVVRLFDYLGNDIDETITSHVFE